MASTAQQHQSKAEYAAAYLSATTDIPSDGATILSASAVVAAPSIPATAVIIATLEQVMMLLGCRRTEDVDAI